VQIYGRKMHLELEYHLIFLTLIALTGCMGSSGTSDVVVGVLDKEFELPAGGATGLAWGDGLLWTVNNDTDRIYAIDPDTGDVEFSFAIDHDRSLHLTGLAYSSEHNMILVGLWDGSSDGYVYRYSATGEHMGSVSMCGG